MLCVYPKYYRRHRDSHKMSPIPNGEYVVRAESIKYERGRHLYPADPERVARIELYRSRFEQGLDLYDGTPLYSD